ncbi:DUF6328 family protein [Georgenia sp. SYP-B2076]|uniref:DUF6328 family protein n=1 Tax=Georgenia sp. SYP-B2076 TaxID=2495881 RepID=UPI001F0C72A3|nr:DUF6328 family protein [Georgenia sp. SYP-B2076]
MDEGSDGRGRAGRLAQASGPDDDLSDGRRESPEQRADRNWNELLQELRVTQTGVQILTGFLLTLPFQNRFADLAPDQVVVYLVLVILAAATTVLVIAPVSLHRLLFQRRLKPELVRAGHLAVLGGLVSLALVVSGTVLLIFDVVVGRGAAIGAAGGILAVLLVGWLLVPILFGRRGRRRP